MEGILSRPRCPACGFQVENDCPVGAGCPGCGKRLGLEGLSAPAVAELQAENAALRETHAELVSRLDEVGKENVELKARLAEYRERFALDGAPTPTPTEGEGGGGNG